MSSEFTKHLYRASPGDAEEAVQCSAERQQAILSILRTKPCHCLAPAEVMSMFKPRSPTERDEFCAAQEQTHVLTCQSLGAGLSETGGPQVSAIAAGPEGSAERER